MKNEPLATNVTISYDRMAVETLYKPHARQHTTASDNVYAYEPMLTILGNQLLFSRTQRCLKIPPYNH